MEEQRVPVPQHGAQMIKLMRIADVAPAHGGEPHLDRPNSLSVVFKSANAAAKFAMFIMDRFRARVNIVGKRLFVWEGSMEETMHPKDYAYFSVGTDGSVRFATELSIGGRLVGRKNRLVRDPIMRAKVLRMYKKYGRKDAEYLDTPHWDVRIPKDNLLEAFRDQAMDRSKKLNKLRSKKMNKAEELIDQLINGDLIEQDDDDDMDDEEKAKKRAAAKKKKDMMKKKEAARCKRR